MNLKNNKKKDQVKVFIVIFCRMQVINNLNQMKIILLRVLKIV